MKNIGNFKKKQNDLERRIFGCSAHFSDYFLHECNHGGVYAWKAPAGTSDFSASFRPWHFRKPKENQNKV